ncbi:MAG TPA: tyrosine-type recombinase/integrase [Bordetella sp.]|nr:tyrosine-type recombinase/integrase [Bordetella sp.]
MAFDQRTAWVAHDEAKSGNARTVPLNDDAIEVLERRLKTARGLVFTHGDSLMISISQNDGRDFERACQLVGVEDLHWRGLRHTWESWHARRSMPLMALKEPGVWQTIERSSWCRSTRTWHRATSRRTLRLPRFWPDAASGQKKRH